MYKKLGKEIIKTIHVTDNIYEKINTLNFDDIDYLLDTSSKQMVGGTGMSLIGKSSKLYHQRSYLLLAG